ncbi:hypothetical protein MHK_010574, partial [Candidatus Magnetomorum sp. HK-1]
MTQSSNPLHPVGNDTEGYFNLGIYFPSTLSMSEDTVANVLFSVTDPDSNILTLTVISSDQDILKDSNLILSTDDNQANPLIDSVAPGVPLSLTLSIQPELDRNGTVVITLEAFDDTGSSTQTLTL